MEKQDLPHIIMLQKACWCVDLRHLEDKHEFSQTVPKQKNTDPLQKPDEL